MRTPEVIKQLERFANNDMRMARKEDDGIVIVNTNAGNVNLKYWPIEKKYFITTYYGEVLYQGEAKGCREVIVNLYDVVA